jgi:hypothetical protein
LAGGGAKAGAAEPVAGMLAALGALQREFLGAGPLEPLEPATSEALVPLSRRCGWTAGRGLKPLDRPQLANELPDSHSTNLSRSRHRRRVRGAEVCDLTQYVRYNTGPYGAQA